MKQSTFANLQFWADFCGFTKLSGMKQSTFGGMKQSTNL